MPAFFDLLTEETDPAVRVVLGHFIFVYIHPYRRQRTHGAVPDEYHDGAGGYPWTLISLSERKAYMASLEKASVGEDIGPFADFLARLVQKSLAGEPLPEVPESTTKQR